MGTPTYSTISKLTLTERYTSVTLAEARESHKYFPLTAPGSEPLGKLPVPDLTGLTKEQADKVQAKYNKELTELEAANEKKGIGATQPLRGPVPNLLVVGQPEGSSSPVAGTGPKGVSARKIFPAHQPTDIGAKALLEGTFEPAEPAKIKPFTVSKIRNSLTVTPPLGIAQLGMSTVDLSKSIVAKPVYNRWLCNPAEGRYSASVAETQVIEDQLKTIKPGTPLYATGEQDPPQVSPKTGFRPRSTHVTPK